jgi:hypothetical protein
MQAPADYLFDPAIAAREEHQGVYARLRGLRRSAGAAVPDFASAPSGLQEEIWRSLTPSGLLL